MLICYVVYKRAEVLIMDMLLLVFLMGVAVGIIGMTLLRK